MKTFVCMTPRAMTAGASKRRGARRPRGPHAAPRRPRGPGGARAA
jgi:hypothetical protein